MPRDDDFQVVTRRRRGAARKIPRGLHNLTAGNPEEEPEIDVDRVSRQIQAAVKEISESGYVDILLSRLDEGLRSIRASTLGEIICYGLGNFSQFRASKFQLAAIVAIKTRYASKVFAYDPLFYRSEIQVLKNLGLQPIEKNEEAKRAIGDVTSLVYMPHCPYQLTNNFIYANWKLERLANLIVLSNSFDELADSIYPKSLDVSENYIARVHPYTTEITLENSFRYEDIFNGSSIHAFRREDLARAPEDFWDNRDEPIYREEHCEFVRANRLNLRNRSGE